MTDRLLKVAEVAKMLRLDHTTVRRWIKLGILPAITLPSKNERLQYRIRESTIDKILHAEPEPDEQHQLI
jgi:excisionase family DNA binding protein